FAMRPAADFTSVNVVAGHSPVGLKRWFFRRLLCVFGESFAIIKNFAKSFPPSASAAFSSVMCAASLFSSGGGESSHPPVGAPEATADALPAVGFCGGVELPLQAKTKAPRAKSAGATSRFMTADETKKARAAPNLRGDIAKANRKSKTVRRIRHKTSGTK